MPKRNFFIKESELDDYQIQVINNNANNLIVKGCAGSGKSILALWKAKQIQEEKKGTFLFIVKMNSLKKYMADGIQQIGINAANVESFDKCFQWMKSENGDLERGEWKKDVVDFILVDEAQDLSKDDILLLKSKAKSIFFYGDTAQQLMDFDQNKTPVSMEDIAYFTKLPMQCLVFNYRLPKKIARLANYLNSENDDLEAKCKNEGSELPQIYRYNTLDEELDDIITIIKNRHFKDVGILFRSKKNVKYAADYFRNKEFPVEAKIGTNADDLNFNSDNPKLMTYHSAKGLQFEAVFLPECTCSNDEDKNPLYVAITRTYQSLYIMHSGNLSEFFDAVPTNLYETETKEEIDEL